MYYSIAPYDMSDVNDHDTRIYLSKGDIQKIKKQIKDINVHNWGNIYKNYDEENTTGSFSWDLRIEYKNGTIEVHSGDGIGSAPKGFYDIKASLDNIIE